MIILYEKYKNGLGSEFYREIAKINNFLKDKNSITVTLKNGTIFKTDSRLRDILNIYSDGNIYISQTYHQKIIHGEKFSSFQYKANELDSLKYGKTELKINTENLVELSKKDTKEIEREDTEEI